MKQDQLFSLLRTLLTLAGAFITGGGIHLFGQVVDTAYWEEITGIVMAVASVLWSISTKTLDIEKLQGTVRQVITFICGILVAKHVLKAEVIPAILALVAAIFPFFQAGLTRVKNQMIADGDIKHYQLKK